ncbi:MAG TPA: hypothetical protein VES65_09210 [Solirubrobacteraceae bacterium]|nr:hypothetical protein [Solirubrobacteraceae bacterium]
MTELAGADGQRRPAGGPVCRLCSEKIGVYEPLVVVEQGRARTTSRALEPALSTAPGEYRHLACHERGEEEPPRSKLVRTLTG